MNSAKLVLAVIVAGALNALGCGAAMAQDKNKIVTDRQETMKTQSRELGSVRGWFQGKLDQQAAIAAMDAVQKSVSSVPDLFPTGTGIGEVSVKTRAKPEIWQEHDKFLAAHKTVLGQLAELDAAVKAGDKAKAETEFGQIKFCESCHATFRANEK